MVIRKVGVWSAARIYGALSATMGLLFGLCLAALSSIGFGMANNDAPAWLGPVFGIGGIILLPLFYGAMGIVMGAISAALYNIFASAVGGLSVDVE
jgi:hypothetical protein